VTVTRDNDAERRARIAALLRQARALRAHAAAARERAQALLARAAELSRQDEQRRHREALLKRATEALKAAKVEPRTAIRRFRIGGRRKAR
jgi:hypothetical protein